MRIPRGWGSLAGALLIACAPGGTAADTAAVETAEVDPHGAGELSEVKRGRLARGERVSLRGLVVTAVTDDGLFVADGRGGPWRGVFVHLGAEHADGAWSAQFAPGDVVDVDGVVDVWRGARDGVARVEVRCRPDEVVVRGVARTPAPVPVTVEALLEDPAAWDGVLVRVNDVSVADADVGYGEWVTEDGLVVDDRLHAQRVYAGERFVSLTGIVHIDYGVPKLEPRGADDVGGHSARVHRAEDLGAGDLVITEVMAAPVACGPDAEYVEIANRSGGAVDLSGVALETSAGRMALAARAVVPKDAVVVVATAQATACYGIGAHVTLTLPLADDGDVLALVAGAEVIDRVDTHTIRRASGAASSLDARATEADVNDRASAWCPARRADWALRGPEGDGADRGSPGAANGTRCF